MTIALRLQPLVQVLKIALQIPPILLLAYTVYPDRRIFALTVVGALQGWHIDQMGQ